MTNLKATAHLTGLLYCLMIPTAIFAMIYMPTTLIDLTNIPQTLANLQANTGLFKTAIAVSVMVQLLQLAVALAFYWLFCSVDQRLALSIVVLTAMSVTLVLGIELSYVAITYLLNSSLFSAEEQLRWLEVLLNLHQDGIHLAEIFWGLWLLPMGLLLLKSGWVPQLIGWALILVFTAYSFDSFSALFDVQWGFKVTEWVGWLEILLPVWLLVKGVKVNKA